jgi:perosamine synthetase
LIPIYEPLIGAEEKRNVIQALDSGWISSRGEFVERFEYEFARFSEIENTATCTNGTVALHLALLALGIGPGDEVIVPDFSYIAAANTVVHAGGRPIFCDVDSETWQISLDSLMKSITPRTKAIIVVHTYGGVAELNQIRQIADQAGIKMIEDCAEAIGSKYLGRHVGYVGDIATFSFFGNKTITTGEGGLVASRSPELIKLVRRLKNQGIAEGYRYHHDIIAYNYRMTNIACAIGCAQLTKVDSILYNKELIWQKYLQGLSKTPLIPQKFIEDSKPSYWLCCFVAPSGRKEVDALSSFLTARNIETRPGFGLLTQMPMYSDIKYDNPNSNYLANSVICLPSFPGLSGEQQTVIIDAINQYYGV